VVRVEQAVFSMALIDIDDLTFQYPGSPIFNRLSLKFELPEPGARARIISVSGASGCGKTTLLRLIAGLERPQSGRISQDPSGLMLSYLTQEPVIFNHLSREVNAAYFRRIGAFHEQFDVDLFQRLTAKLRLESVMRQDFSPSMMSGGEKQRLCLLRALSIRPRILLLDEPCTGLDLPVKREFLMMLREVADDFGLLVLYVTHHPEEARLVADEMLYMLRDKESTGVVLAGGRLSQVIVHPPTIDVAQLFIGPFSNILDCFLEAGVVKLCPDGRPLGRCVSHSAVTGKCKLVFSPESVRWTDLVGQDVFLYARSDQFCFARLSRDGMDIRIVGPWSEAKETRMVLSGPAYLFGSSDMRGEQVTIADLSG